MVVGQPHVGLSGWLDTAIGILGLLGLYAYVFNKKIFSSQIWKIVFGVTLLFLGVFILQAGFNVKVPFFIKYVQDTSGVGAIGGILLTLPAYYALYQLTKNKFASDKK